MAEILHEVDIIKHGFVLPKRIDLVIDEREIEIPAKLIMPLGEKPPIQIE